VELERNLTAIKKQGLGVAAISYDSVAVLKNFADRQHLTYPLLSDSGSRTIRGFGILNETVKPDTAFYGIPYPGTYIVNAQGKVKSKYFEDDFRERVSASDILIQESGKQADAARRVSETKHLRLAASASTQVARPGHRIVLSLDVTLNPRMHVYAPGVRGYIPIDWKLEEGTAAKPQAFVYPASQMMHLKVIGETVPVYRNRIRINREITFGPEVALKQLLSPAGDLILKGSFRYQACDDRECYIPQTVPLEWHFHFEGLERERVPEELQRKLR
jgi:alkyl hydroperoxide reductase subunit AhpC